MMSKIKDKTKFLRVLNKENLVLEVKLIDRVANLINKIKELR